LVAGGATCTGCRFVCARGAAPIGAPPKTPRPVCVAPRTAGAAAAGYVDGAVAARRDSPRALLVTDTAVLIVQPVSLTELARHSDAARRCVSTAHVRERLVRGFLSASVSVPATHQ